MAKSAEKVEQEIDSLLATRRMCAQGLWLVMRRIMEHPSNKRPGVLWQGRTAVGPEALADLANATGKIVEKSLRQLEAVGLIVKDARDVYHSPRITRLVELRRSGRTRTQKWRESQSEEGGVSRDTQKGVTTDPRDTHVTPSPSTPSRPPPFSSPTTPPISTPLPSPDSLFPGATPPGAIEPAAAGKQPPGPKRRGGERVLTDAQLAIRDAFQDWWRLDAWPSSHHGVAYDFTSGDYAAVLKVLRSKSIEWDLAEAKALAAHYLTEPEMFGCQGHGLIYLGHKLNFFRSRAAARTKGQPINGNHKPHRTAADRGEYVSSLPSGSQQLADVDDEEDGA